MSRAADETERPAKGARRFRLWKGGLSGAVFAGWMVFDGERWCATGKKHDVTDDYAMVVEDGNR